MDISCSTDLLLLKLGPSLTPDLPEILQEDRKELVDAVKQETNDPPKFIGMTIDDVKAHGEISGANIAKVIKEKLREAGCL